MENRVPSSANVTLSSPNPAGGCNPAEGSPLGVALQLAFILVASDSGLVLDDNDVLGGQQAGLWLCVREGMSEGAAPPSFGAKRHCGNHGFGMIGPPMYVGTSTLYAVRAETLEGQRTGKTMEYYLLPLAFLSAS